MSLKTNSIPFVKKLQTEIPEYIHNKLNDEYIITEWNNEKKEVVLQHKENKYFLPFTYRTFSEYLNNSTKKSFYDRFKKINTKLKNLGDYSIIEYPTHWTEQHDKNFVVRHNTCRHVWTTSAKYITDKRRCPVCYGRGLWKDRNREKITEEEFIKRLYAQVGNEYSYISGFKNMSTTCTLIHNSCGNKWKISPSSFLGLRANRCPRCANLSERKWENDVKERILEFTDTEIIIDYKDYPNPNNKRYRVEYDLFLPEYKLAIELNGNIFHSTLYKTEKEARDHMLRKTKYAASKGIKLIHFYWDEWQTEEKREIILSRILSYMGIYPNGKYYGRKSYIDEVDSKTANKFYIEHHLQGKASSASLHLGLYSKDNDELLSVMSFGYRKISGKHNFELIRFSSQIGIQVHGAASKLFTYLLTNYDLSEFTEIISYADLRFSSHPDFFLNSLVYTQIGFRFINCTKPSYYYAKSGSLKESRHKYQKHKLKDIYPESYSNSKTEFEIMDENKWGRLYNCGNAKFSYDLSEINNI